jgi:hypothetical protein
MKKYILFLSGLLMVAGCATNSDQARYTPYDPSFPTAVGGTDDSTQTTTGAGGKKVDNSPIIVGPRFSR